MLASEFEFTTEFAFDPIEATEFAVDEADEVTTSFLNLPQLITMITHRTRRLFMLLY